MEGGRCECGGTEHHSYKERVVHRWPWGTARLSSSEDATKDGKINDTKNNSKKVIESPEDKYHSSRKGRTLKRTQPIVTFARTQLNLLTPRRLPIFTDYCT